MQPGFLLHDRVLRPGRSCIVASAGREKANRLAPTETRFHAHSTITICDACGHAFEEWQSFKDDAADEVPAVQEEQAPSPLRRRCGDHLQGVGFYETDYRRDGETKTATAKARPSERRSRDEAETKAEPATEPAPEPPRAGTAKCGGKGSPKKKAIDGRGFRNGRIPEVRVGANR